MSPFLFILCFLGALGVLFWIDGRAKERQRRERERRGFEVKQYGQKNFTL